MLKKEIYLHKPEPRGHGLRLAASILVLSPSKLISVKDDFNVKANTYDNSDMTVYNDISCAYTCNVRA